MPRHLLPLLLFLALAPALAFSQEPSTASASLKKDSEKCAKALLTADFDTVVSCMHTRVVGLMGGKDAIIAKMKEGAAQMQAQGISFAEVTIGQPKEPQKVGDWLVAVVPQTILMKVPGGQLVQESHLLGISEDGGKSWLFVDLNNPAKVAQAFPEFEGKLALPERKVPVFKKE